MSLDLYILSERPILHRGTGVFVRDNGQTRELQTIEEVKAHFPDADTSDIEVYEWMNDKLFRVNLTHNLTEMASHVPIECAEGHYTMRRYSERDDPDWKPRPLTAYNLLWHPETNPLLSQRTAGLWDVIAITPELIRQCMDVYCYTAFHRQELETYNPSNGWGSYEQLLKATHDLVVCLLEIPVEDYDNYYLYCST